MPRLMKLWDKFFINKQKNAVDGRIVNCIFFVGQRGGLRITALAAVIGRALYRSLRGGGLLLGAGS